MIQDDFRAVIDVGTTKVTAMLVQRRPDREVELLGVGAVSYTHLTLPTKRIV